MRHLDQTAGTPDISSALPDSRNCTPRRREWQSRCCPNANLQPHLPVAPGAPSSGDAEPSTHPLDLPDSLWDDHLTTVTRHGHAAEAGADEEADYASMDLHIHDDSFIIHREGHRPRPLPLPGLSSYQQQDGQEAAVQLATSGQRSLHQKLQVRIQQASLLGWTHP